MDFRLYRLGDFAQLYAMEEACFKPPQRFGRWYMRQLVGSSRAATWIAEEDGQMAGFGIITWSTASVDTVAYIVTIEVAAEARRRGVGGELLRRIEGSARAAGAGTIWLHVGAENAPAIRLYEAHGYRRQGREERYYGRGRAALIYAKELGAPEAGALAC